jgi:hypothetical protein
MYVKEIGFENVDWINMTQSRVQWQAFMNVAMDLKVL